jgi:plastocyanin
MTSLLSHQRQLSRWNPSNGDVSLFSAIVRTIVLMAMYGSATTLAETSWPAVEQAVLQVEVVIKARQFQPSPLLLPAGREVELVLKNQDAELHAFVPLRFLDNLAVHIDGSGAPQFGDRGLVRLLIPSGGWASIRFRPQTTGVYQYRCDLPGHQMLGQIVVQSFPVSHKSEG